MLQSLLFCFGRDFRFASLDLVCLTLQLPVSEPVSKLPTACRTETLWSLDTDQIPGVSHRLIGSLTNTPQHLPIYLPPHLPAYLSTCILTNLPAHQPAYLLNYLPACLPSCQSAYLPAFLPACLPTCLLAFLPA